MDFENVNEVKKFSIKEFIKNLNSSKKIKLIIAGVLFFVILLIFSSTILPVKSENKQEIKNSLVTTNSYAENVEQRLENILSCVSGLSNVKVFIYVESTEEIVYLKDLETSTNSSTQGNSTSRETTVFNKDGTSSSAVVVVTKYPKIEGILIVAHGLNDSKVKLKIIDAVSCVLSIAPNSIEVLEGKS